MVLTNVFSFIVVCSEHDDQSNDIESDANNYCL